MTSPFRYSVGGGFELREQKLVHEDTRIRARHRRAESRGERPLLGPWQRADELDPVGAEVEEAEDRAARLRHGKRGGNRRQRDRCDERPAPSPPREREREARRRGPLDRQGAELTLEIHTPPSAGRAHATCAT